MSYDKKTVRSRPGLSQEEALTSLQDHPLYRPGTKIASIRRRGDRWVAELLEPKTAGELEDESGDEEGPAEVAPKPKKPAFADEGGDDEGGEDEGGPDGPPGSDSEGGDSAPGGKGGEKAEVAQLLHLVQQICDALGIAGTPDPGMGGPDDLGPGAGGPGGPPAPPHGGPGGPPPGIGGPPGAGPGGPQEVHHKTKLGPGEVPPGGTPLGAPAFSHVHHANPGAPGGAASIGVPLPQGGGAGAPTPATGCPHGYPDSSSCPQCAAQGGAGMGANPVVGRARTFVASKRTNVTLHQAKVALEAEFGPQGYHVGQIKRDDNDASVVRALLVANGR